MRTYPLATLGILLLVLLFVVFFGRSFESVLPWIAAVVLVILLNIISGSLALRWNAERQRLRDEQVARSIREILLTAINDPEDQRSRRALLEHDPIDIYRAGADLPPDEQQALRFLMCQTGLDRAGVRRAAAEPRKWEQIQALRMLGWLGSDVAVPLLAAELKGSDNDKRLAAADAMAHIDDPGAYEALLDALSRDLLPPSRVATFVESSRYDDPVPALAARAGPGGAAEVRFWIAYLLGRTGRPEALPVLQTLAGDPNLDVRASAAEALGAFSGFPEAQDTLIALMSDSEWPVRSHAAKAVSAGGEVYAPQLVELLHDSTWWVRQNAAFALERLGNSVMPLLIGALRSEDEFARNKASEVLVRLHAIPTMISRLSDYEKADDAADTLVRLAEAGAMAKVIEDLADAPVQARLRLRAVLPADSPTLHPLIEALAPASALAEAEPVERTAERGQA